jgi:hypothetical protein
MRPLWNAEVRLVVHAVQALHDASWISSTTSARSPVTASIRWMPS